MRVLLVRPSQTSTGGDKFTTCLADGLARRGDIHVGMVAIDDLSTGVAPGTRAVFVGSQALRVPGAVTVFWPLNVAPFERLAVIQGSTSLRSAARYRLLRVRLRTSLRRADALVFGSRHARTLYTASSAHAARLPATVIRGGAPSLNVTPQRRDPAAERQRRERPLLLIVSHLYPYKGVVEAAEALVRVGGELPPGTHVRVAGAARDPRYAARVVETLGGLPSDVTAEVRVADATELRSLYEEASAAIFPSTCENAGSFGLFDGLHAGVPTVCSDRSSMSEVVDGAVRFANPFEPEIFGEAILEVLRGDELRSRLVDAALGWSARALTWQDRADRLAAFLRGLQ